MAERSGAGLGPPDNSDSLHADVIVTGPYAIIWERRIAALQKLIEAKEELLELDRLADELIAEEAEKEAKRQARKESRRHRRQARTPRKSRSPGRPLQG